MFSAMCTAPESMRQADRDDPVFDPLLVSIGPFHHSKLPAMEDHKSQVLSSMLARHNEMNPDDPKDLLMIKLADAMKKLEKKTRECYSRSFQEINFPKMMASDGCFVLEIFRIHAGLYTNDEDDPIFTTRWMLPVLALDMVKLENQLPYFVLKKLYEMTKLPEEPPLNHLAGAFLALLRPELNKLKFDDGQSKDHLLALFHAAFIPNKNTHLISIDEGDELNCGSFPSVTNLRLSGIKTVKKKTKKQETRFCNPLDIEYRNRRLVIPTLVVDQTTKILMRNLIAYEQCSKRVQSIFTSYITFIDALVNSVQDIEVLREAGVVITRSMASDEQVSKLLSSLVANVKTDLNEGYLAGLSARICSDRHSRMARWSFLDRFSSFSFKITVFVLYLTVLQTVFTALSYFHPKA